jgi:hypothetical protein
MTTKFFLKNKLPSILSTRDGGLDIPPYGYAPIREVDCENLTVLYALDRGWAEIVNEEPTDKASTAKEVEIEVVKPYEGLTIEQLQAEQATKAAEKEAKEAEKETEAASKASKAKKAA